MTTPAPEAVTVALLAAGAGALHWLLLRLEERGLVYYLGRARVPAAPPAAPPPRRAAPAACCDALANHVRPVRSALRSGERAEEARAAQHARGLEEREVYHYVVDDLRRLVGVVPLARLLLAEAGEVVDALMEREVACVAGRATLHEAREALARHRLLALPVVDEAGRLLGVVDAAWLGCGNESLGPVH